MSLTMYAQVCPPDSDERESLIVEYFEAYRSLTASNPTQSRELLEGTLQEGCFSSSDDITAVTLMLLAAAHGAMGSKEKMRELYKTAFAK
eukprot:5900038-Amphidinium_carterae.1